ncbi:MAG: nucleotidyl transferase AbiEii/AbiGii toxin family protein [Candidatus Omnitrophota bacterium]|nr:nucleotidyl transferase AbiEii/AbiGii toxin family protein [Candidatus Omnitrophota bacterium]
MKDYALELAASQKGYNAKLNIMREYLQAYVLRILQDSGVFRTTAFLGGTALRFLYALPRFSEDLDFSVTENLPFSFGKMMKKIEQELRLAGYNISVVYNDKKTVHDSMIKFEGLLYEAGLSPLPKQKFSIKVEIDTNPPRGAVLKTHIINKYFPISFLSYDIPSLFAGKLHALLSRQYTKGRDFFDIGWYLSRWRDVNPNIGMLGNCLRQTGWKGLCPSLTDWRTYIYKVVEKTDWNNVVKDVGNFLENPRDMEVFSKENILNLLKD